MSDLTHFNHFCTLFDQHFARPTAFFNMGCCIPKKLERPLLSLTRDQLTQQMLAPPLSHYGSCFGTFEQIGYFVPRVVELLASRGDPPLCNLPAFFSMLLTDQPKYEQRQLWQPLVRSITDAFWARTQHVSIKHIPGHGYEVPSGRVLDHLDLVQGSETLDEILGCFLYPSLSAIPGQWEAFFERWASDLDPHRLAHLLDMLKRRWEGRGPLTPEFVDMPLPASLVAQHTMDDLVRRLIDRVQPLALQSSSPTWLDDLHIAALEEARN
jgi:hypothetical protein